jgi:hypothetical protein
MSFVILLLFTAHSQSVCTKYHLSKIFTLSVFDTVQECIYNIYKTSFSPGSVQ